MVPCRHALPAGEHPKSVEAMLSQLGVYLRTAVYGLDTRPLLKEAASKVFGSAAGMVDMMVRHVPSARKATATKVTQDYSGAMRRGKGGGYGMAWMGKRRLYRTPQNVA